MTIHHVALGGIRLAYLDEGTPDARAVVLQHGFPDSPRSFDGIAHRLVAAGYRVVRPWLPGCPPSEVPGRPLTVQVAADWLEALARSLELLQPVLVGHDWGAVLGWQSVERDDNPWSAFVPMSIPPVGFLAGNLARQPGQLVRSAYMPLLSAPGGHRLVPTLVERLWRIWSPSLEPPVKHLAGVERMLRQPDASRAAASLYRTTFLSAISSPGSWPAGPGGVPVRYLHGDEDGCISVDWAERLADVLPPGTVQIIEGAGHFLQLEREGVVAAAILDHIQGATAPAAT